MRSAGAVKRAHSQTTIRRGAPSSALESFAVAAIFLTVSVGSPFTSGHSIISLPAEGSVIFTTYQLLALRGLQAAAAGRRRSAPPDLGARFLRRPRGALRAPR